MQKETWVKKIVRTQMPRSIFEPPIQLGAVACSVQQITNHQLDSSSALRFSRAAKLQENLRKSAFHQGAEWAPEGLRANVEPVVTMASRPSKVDARREGNKCAEADYTGRRV
jgi:hypothetical protein